MKNQCQNLTETQYNEWLKSLPKFEELFGGTLGNCKIDTVDLELKEYSKPIFRDHIQYRRCMSKCSKIRLKV